MSTSATSVSQSERQYILQGCRDDCRSDGRQRHEFRPYSCVVNDMCLSYGSARVFLPSGATHVIVSIKAELVIPPTTSSSSSSAVFNDGGGGDWGRRNNEEGAIEVHVDFMHRQNRAAEDDLESILTTLLVPHLVDPKDLCVSPDHYAWKLNIDILVIASGGGSLVDACSLGIRAALKRTLLPKITLVTASGEGPSSTATAENDNGRPTIQVDSDIRSAVPIPGIVAGDDDNGGNRIPTIVTVSVLRDDQKSPLLIVDATGEEECCSFAQIHVVLQKTAAARNRKQQQQGKGEQSLMICALHKAGGGAVPFGILQDVTSFALESLSEVNDVVVQESQALYHILQDNFDIQ
jgi:exosome complex RNA-binding protein Rrp42 (RNase PH superfamily)